MAEKRRKLSQFRHVSTTGTAWVEISNEFGLDEIAVAIAGTFIGRPLWSDIGAVWTGWKKWSMSVL